MSHIKQQTQKSNTTTTPLMAGRAAAMTQKILDRLNDLTACIYPLIDDEVIAEFSVDVFFKYNNLTPAMQKTFIEFLQIDIAIDRLNQTLDELGNIHGVLNDLNEYEWHDMGAYDFIVLALEHLTHMLNERGALLGYDEIDPIDLQQNTCEEVDAETVAYESNLKRGMARMQERLQHAPLARPDA